MALSEVGADNARLRIDAGFFSRLSVETHRRIEALPHVRLGDQCSIFRKGIFDIKADSYTATGIPFVRIGNLGDGLLDTRGMAFIAPEVHHWQSSTALVFGDFVISKTAYASAALVTVPECNVSQDIIAASLSPDGRRTLRSGFVVAYLTCTYGRALMQRRFQGNVQEHLSLADARGLLVPVLSEKLQDAVDAAMHAGHEHRTRAADRLEGADREVERAMGLAGWDPPRTLAYTDTMSAVLAADRFDAEYHHPAKRACLERLAELPGSALGEHYATVRDIFDPAVADAGSLVRNFDLNDALQPVLDDSKPLVDAASIKSHKKRIKAGDVVTSRLRAYLRETALVRTAETVPAVGSTEFLVLRRRGYSDLSQPALLAFLRSRPVQTILHWSQDGSHHPRYDGADLLAIAVPDAVCRASEVVGELVDGALAERDRAAHLLAAARRAVELAVEGDENAGLKQLS